MRVEFANGLALWRFAGLAREPGLRHFVSTRAGGVSPPPYDSLNLAFHVGDRSENVRENRRRLAQALGVDPAGFVAGTQVHGADVRVVTPDLRGAGAAEAETALPATDALVTNTPELVLLVLQADCVPILLYDPHRRVAGLAHAGWGGTVHQVAARTVQCMQREFGCDPADMLAALGPSIGPCCYEVGADVIARVRGSQPEAEAVLRPHATAGKAYLDLWGANETQLLASGLRPGRIERADVCTRCRADVFFSDRRQRPTGRFAAGLMLVAEPVVTS